MARIRVPLVLGPNGLHPVAPTFVEVAGSYTPNVPAKADANGVMVGVALGDPAVAGVTVMVDVPDDEVTGGKYDTATVKAKYPNHWLVTSGVIK